MADFEKMYYQLFNDVTTAINILQNAQMQSENDFVNSKETQLISV